jgi:hypothetical protein
MTGRAPTNRRTLAAAGELAAGLFAALALIAPASATAQVVLFSPETVHGVLDLRLAVADGEPSFTEGGFGKATYGGDGSNALQTDANTALAALEWTPSINWDWSAVVDVAHQPGQEHWIDLLQAYAVFKPTPRSTTRFQARFGYFYPPVSLENDRRVWGLTDTITPSAIDSWIGEEVKVVGAEGTISHDFGGDRLAATGALFGYDDTAGTLLSFRGWSLEDRQSQLNGSFPLPPLSPFFDKVQDDETYTSREIDGRVGYYAKLQWSSGEWPVMLEVLHYDNRGDRTSVDGEQQWAWGTSFTDVGATARLGKDLRFRAQALTGRTQMGFETPTGSWVDVNFRSAYLSATKDIGADALTLRADVFDTHDRSMAFDDNKDEDGWALTGAWRRPLNRYLDLRLEALRVDSTRPARALADEPPHQAQTILQSSLRASF